MKRQTIKLISIILLCIAAQTTTLTAQCNSSSPNSSPVISRQTHERVLDILFPRQYLTAAEADFYIVIRFMPSSAAESQISISKFKNKVQVTEHKSLSGNIYSSLNRMLAKTCREDAVEMAKQFKAETKSVNISPAIATDWHNKLLTSFGGTFNLVKQRSQRLDKTREVSIVLDGTVYQLWYENTTDEMEFKFYDEETEDSQITGVLPTVQWMNTVRREVQKVK